MNREHYKKEKIQSTKKNPNKPIKGAKKKEHRKHKDTSKFRTKSLKSTLKNNRDVIAILKCIPLGMW